jgi:hypothetical protein
MLNVFKNFYHLLYQYSHIKTRLSIATHIHGLGEKAYNTKISTAF